MRDHRNPGLNTALDWRFAMSRRVGLASVLSLLTAACVTHPLLAQDVPVVEVPDAPNCPRCRIEIDTVALLGTPAGEGSLSGIPSMVRVDSRGRYWVFDPQTRIRVFGADGVFLQGVGGHGRGPGEFVYPGDAFPVSGDSMVVLDGIMRATVVGPDLVPGRAIQLFHILSPAVALHWPDTVVVQGQVGTPAGAGWPLHRGSFAGSEVDLGASFGAERGERRPGGFEHVMQLIAPARGGGFWTADRVRYRIHRWSASLVRLQTVERGPPWFAKESRYWVGDKTTPPPPLVNGISEDSTGLIWCLVSIPSSDWKSAWPNYREGTTELTAASVAIEKFYDTAIEVIDPEEGRVVTRRVLQSYPMGALPGGRAALYGLDANDNPRVAIIRLRVVGR
jgi:hypothetical protein